MPRPRRGSARPGGRLLAGAAVAVCVAVAALILTRPAPPPPPEIARPGPTPVPATPSPEGPMIALVIDDVGNDAELARRLLDLPVPLTVAVLPHLPHSGGYSGAGAGGKEVLLHLPMEPEGYPATDPGPGALLVGMPPEALASAVASALASVPGAVGVNNHMGSRFTARNEGMRTLLGDLAGRGLFFLDSRTTPATVSGGIASEVGLPWLSRDVFLDADADPAMMGRRWSEATSLAASRGRAVLIGHLRPATIDFIEGRVREGDWGGAAPVTVSALLRGGGRARPRS